MHMLAVEDEAVPGAAIIWRVLLAETLEIQGRAIALNPRPRSVLLCLLLQANQTVTVGAICDFVWGEEHPKTAVNSVARFVADLRKALGAFRYRVETAPGGYRLVVQQGELDIDIVSDQLAAANRLRLVDPDRSAGYLDSALAAAGNSTNPALGELSGTETTVRAHVELRIALLDLFGDVEVRRGNQRSILPVLELAVTNHPFHEPLWIQLMTALHSVNRTVDALRTGQRARQILAEAGLDPSREFRQLESELAGASAHSVVAASASVSPVSHAPHAMSEPDTRLVGRLRELQELETLVASTRLVSIVGLGGVGKTRLGLALVRPIEAAGTTVFRIGLRSTTEDRLVVATIASALGVPAGQASDEDALAQAVARDSFVLLLDNCEHVRTVCKSVVAAFVRHAPNITVITTSRQALGVDGEHVYQLGMLPIPTAGEVSTKSAAVAMLIDRAEHHLESANSISGGLHHLCDIARLLSGHPLATEVAAAQLAYVTVEELASSLHAAVNPHDATPHGALNSLIQVMDWSWSVLTPSQQTVLARVSIFGGWWTLDAAAALCAEQNSLADDLDALQASGLLIRIGTNGESRYQLLEPARTYGIERLSDRSELAVMHDRLVSWLQGLAGQWTPSQQHVWATASTRLFQEHGNLTAALSYLEGVGRTADLVDLSINYSGMMINHGFAEEVALWLGPAIENIQLDDVLRSGAAAMVLAAAHATGDLDDLHQIGLRAIELADGQPHDWIPPVASFLALWALFTPGPLSTDELFEIAQTAAEQSPSLETNLSITQMYRAHVAFCLRQFDDAAEIFGQVLGRTSEPGRLMHVAEVGLGLAHMISGRQEEAQAATHAWRSRSDTDDWHYMVDIARAVILGGSGSAETATADLAEAIRGFPPARLWGRAGELQMAFAILARFREEHELADQLLATVATRDVLLTVTMIELMARREDADDVGWFAIAEELWTRVLPESVDGPEALSNVPELVSLWLIGSSKLPVRN